MENQTLLLQVMAAFTAVAAIALVIMMGFMIATYRAAAALRVRGVEFMDRWEPVANSAQKAIDDIRAQSTDILANVKAVSESSRRQMDKIDALLDDFQSNAQLQLKRIDTTLADSMRRVDDTARIVNETILLPVRQIRGIAAALNAAVGHLVGKARPTPDRATSDEEMFI
jgi:hypothetical protein